MDGSLAERRKTYLINPAFQLRFSILLTLLVFISSLIYPVAIYDLMNDTIMAVGKSLPSYAPILEERRKPLLIILFLWEIGFLALVFIISIFFSHKVAGPLHKIRQYFARIMEGKGREKLSLRKGDYFQDFAEDVNKTIDYIYDEFQQDFIFLDDVVKQLNNLKTTLPAEKRESVEKIVNHLLEMQSRFSNK
ncbi:MAG: methyl-accepting chemotaxis protein [Deltaproteobacteria bacterium]|nr:MAG: methyl-accepting chemotaxis protein [Deltaproteobacteria bacterium]